MSHLFAITQEFIRDVTRTISREDFNLTIVIQLLRLEMKQQSRRIDVKRSTLVLCGKSTRHPGVMGCPWRGRGGIPRIRADLVDDVELQPVFASCSPLSFWNLALRPKIELCAESWVHLITGVTCDCRLFPGVWILSDLLCKCGRATHCCGPGLL